MKKPVEYVKKMFPGNAPKTQVDTDIDTAEIERNTAKIKKEIEIIENHVPTLGNETNSQAQDNIIIPETENITLEDLASELMHRNQIAEENFDAIKKQYDNLQAEIKEFENHFTKLQIQTQKQKIELEQENTKLIEEKNFLSSQLSQVTKDHKKVLKNLSFQAQRTSETNEANVKLNAESTLLKKENNEITTGNKDLKSKNALLNNEKKELSKEISELNNINKSAQEEIKENKKLIQENQDELLKLVQSLEEKQPEISKLLKKVEESQASLLQAQEENSKFEETINEFKDNNTLLSSNIAQKEKSIEEYTEIYDKLKIDYAALESKIDELKLLHNEQDRSKTAENEDLKKENESIAKELAESELQVERLNTALQENIIGKTHLEGKVKNLEEDNARKQTSLEASRKETEKANSKVEKLKEEKSDLESENTLIRAEFKEFKTKNEAEIAQLNEKIAHLESAIENLNKDKNLLEDSLNEAKEAKLQHDLGLKESTYKILKLTEEKDNFATKNQDLEEEKTAILAQLKELTEKQGTNNNEEIIILEGKIKQFESAIEELKIDKNKFEASLKEAEKLENQKSQLETDKALVQIKLDKLILEAEDTKSEVKKLITENNQLETAKGSIQAQLEELRKKQDTDNNEEVAKLKALITQFDNDIKKLSEDKSFLETSLKEAGETIKESTTKVENLEKDKIAIQTQLDELENESKQKITKLKERINPLEENIENLNKDKNKLEALLTEAEEAKSKHENNLKESTTKVEKLTEEKNQLNQKNQELVKKQASMLAELDELQKNQKIENEKYVILINNSKEEILTLTNEIAIIKDLLESNNKLIENLNADNNKILEEKAKLKKEVEELKSISDPLQKTVSAEEEETKKLGKAAPKVNIAQSLPNYAVNIVGTNPSLNHIKQIVDGDIITRYFQEAHNTMDKDPKKLSKPAVQTLAENLEKDKRLASYAQTKTSESTERFHLNDESSYVDLKFTNAADANQQVQISIGEIKNFTGALTIQRFDINGKPTDEYDCIHIKDSKIFDIVSSSEATKENSRVADLIKEHPLLKASFKSNGINIIGDGFEAALKKDSVVKGSSQIRSH